MAASSLILQDASDAIQLITLNRPEKRNALSIALIEELRAAILAASDDKKRRILILRASGPAFCAGLDLTEAADPSRAHASAQALAQLYETICTCPLIVIASAHGAAYGGGAGLISAADLALGADDLHIGFPEVKRGLVAALVTCLLRRQLTDRQVRELILLGRIVPAAEAATLGIITRAVPPSRLAGATLALAHEVCAGAPDAIVRTKRLLDEVNSRPIAEDLRRALAYHLSARQSAEAAEGIAAFTEKRPPRWGNRS